MIVAKSAVIVVIQLFGPSEVTIYNLALRYMSFISMFFMLALTPYLTAFTEAYTKGEFQWIRKTIQSLLYIWMFGGVVSIALLIIQPYFFKVWTKGLIEVPFSLVLTMAISGLINMLSSIFTLFLNGIGRIRIQFYINIFQVVLLFPLIYLFYKLGFGLTSVVLPTIVFYTVGTFIFYIQYKLVISNKAAAIWAK